jgi:hypothetical protein
VSLDEVPLRLDVAGLHRAGDTAALDLRWINRGSRGGDAFSVGDTFSREGSSDLAGVLMVDTRTGHELDPLDRDLEVPYTELAAGGTQSLRLVFPAPSGSSVGLLVPHFGLFGTCRSDERGGCIAHPQRRKVDLTGNPRKGSECRPSRPFPPSSSQRSSFSS